jgi:hypothetical protein
MFSIEVISRTLGQGLRDEQSLHCFGTVDIVITQHKNGPQSFISLWAENIGAPLMLVHFLRKPPFSKGMELFKMSDIEHLKPFISNDK